MEIEVKKETLHFYEFSTVSTAVHEESTETIVPDYCPDIARIIDTDGKVFLRSKDIQGEKAIVTGSVKVTVLFTPEGETGIRNLEFALPFNMSLNNKDFERCQHLFPSIHIQSIESKSLNPRKIFTRVLLAISLQGLRRNEVSFCCDILSDASYGIEKMRKEEVLNLITAYTEKDFTFTDEIAVPAGRDGISEILSVSVLPRIQETKIFGTKLIIKGTLYTELLYRTEQQGITSFSSELPFSQILEIPETKESAIPSIMIHLSGMDYHIGGEESTDDRHRVTLSLYLHAQALLRCEVPINCVCDVYSTVYELTPNVSSLQCTGKMDTVVRHQPMRHLIEIGVVPSAVLSASVLFEDVAISREDSSVILQSIAHIKLLFLDEGNVPLVAERQTECVCRMDLPGDTYCTAKLAQGTDFSTAILAGGIEIRFSADFTVESAERKHILGLSDLSVDTEHPKNTSDLPSIILKLFDEDENLWDIAKRYSTTVDVIRSANDLSEDGKCAAGQMLLIPRKR